MPYFIYILECTDGTYYTGITTDVNRRFKEHQNRKGGHYTTAHPVARIIYTENCTNRSEALKRELQIKALSRQGKIRLITSKNNIM